MPLITNKSGVTGRSDEVTEKAQEIEATLLSRFMDVFTIKTRVRNWLGPVDGEGLVKQFGGNFNLESKG